MRRRLTAGWIADEWSRIESTPSWPFRCGSTCCWVRDALGPLEMDPCLESVVPSPGPIDSGGSRNRCVCRVFSLHVITPRHLPTEGGRGQEKRGANQQPPSKKCSRGGGEGLARAC